MTLSDQIAFKQYRKGLRNIKPNKSFKKKYLLIQFLRHFLQHFKDIRKFLADLDKENLLDIIIFMYKFELIEKNSNANPIYHVSNFLLMFEPLKN